MSAALFYVRDNGTNLPIPVQVIAPQREGDSPLYLVGPPDALQTYKSARQLLIYLNGTDRHWTLNRYLRQGRYSPAANAGEPVVPILEALNLWTSQGIILAETDSIIDESHVPKTYPIMTAKAELRNITGLAESTDLLGGANGLGFATTGIVASSLTSSLDAQMGGTSGGGQGPKLGIDLSRRGHEVAKLLYAGFGSRLYASGYDPEDVLQEVYKGILTRNQGRSAFDARKSSFGHYVHMVISCILSNYHRKVSRTRSNESPWPTGDSGEDESLRANNVGVDINGSGSDAYGSSEQLVQEDFRGYLVAHGSADPVSVLALHILPLVQDGCECAEIARRLGESRMTVSRALSYLRARAVSWSLGAGNCRSGVRGRS